MIHEVDGDILLSHAAAIAHGVAPEDDWKNGLALALRERHPSMVRDFRHWCHEARRKPGVTWGWAGVGPRGPLRIYNLLTQAPPAQKGEHPGRAKVEWVGESLRDLAHQVAAHEVKSLALPRLATGVGGLTWEEVHPLVEKHLGKLDCPVFVYTRYRAGVAADEGL